MIRILNTIAQYVAMMIIYKPFLDLIQKSEKVFITLIWKMVNTAVFLSFISSAMIVLSSLRIFSNISSFILTFVLSEN